MKNISNIILMSLVLSITLRSQNSDSPLVPYSDTSVVAVSQRAEILQGTRNYSSAKAEYLKIRFYHSNQAPLVRFSDFAIADMTLKEGSANNDTEKRNEAKELFEKYIKNYPTDERTPRARFALANIYREELRPDNALVMLNAAAESLRPSTKLNFDSGETMDEKTALYMQAMLSKAQIYSVQNNRDAALDVYDELLGVLQHQPDALLGKAMVLAENDQISAALQILVQLKDKNGPTKEFSQQYYRELLERGE